MKNPCQKIILDYKDLTKKVRAHRTLGQNIVCTIGSWDMLHIGHLRYLSRARDFGDILVVGVDSDRAIKLYKKNPLRPIIPEKERMEMLCYQSFVDYVTLIDDVTNEGRWEMELIKAIRPDSFVATSGESYPDEQRGEINHFCQNLRIIARQAKNTSTSKIVEETFKKRLRYLLDNGNFKL